VSAGSELTARCGGVHIGSIPLLADTARFRPTDPDALVNASLACPVCLRSEDIEWEDSLEGYDPSVQCLCHTCQARWRVYLAPEQALRVGLMHAHAA
jgi:hypothetical protein